ncbi:putative membrane protein [Lachnospiraceae bacterium TWA4]|nr:putative membrane protein [Lachnospiraceae bacterium TWA4]
MYIFFFNKFSEIKQGIQSIITILSPFIYGAVFAYILSPACGWLESHLSKVFKNKTLVSMVSIILCIVLAITVLVALIMLIIPQVITSVMNIINSLPGQINETNEWLHNLLKSQPKIQDYWDDFSADAIPKLDTWMKTDLLPMAQSVLGSVGDQVVNVISVIKNLFLGIMVSIYLLASRKIFARQAKLVLYGVFPKKPAKLIETEVKYADKIFSGFLMGKLVDSFIVGVICFIGTSMMKFESALLISVVIGITNIIPFFGPFIGAIPCVFLLILNNPMQALYFLIFVIILQQVDGNIIGPKILGNSTGLSGFWVLFSILFFGGIWGFVGMLIAVPFFAVLYDIIKKLVFKGLKRHKFKED